MMGATNKPPQSPDQPRSDEDMGPAYWLGVVTQGGQGGKGMQQAAALDNPDLRCSDSIQRSKVTLYVLEITHNLTS